MITGNPHRRKPTSAPEGEQMDAAIVRLTQKIETLEAASVRGLPKGYALTIEDDQLIIVDRRNKRRGVASIQWTQEK